MMKVNPCVTGETLVLTASGPVSFEKLAKMNKDVEVYCYDTNGDIILSKRIYKNAVAAIFISNIYSIIEMPKLLDISISF